MQSTQMNIRMDAELYRNFTHIAENIGLSAGSAAKVMIRQFVARGGFVATPELVDIPNAVTVAAMNDKEVIHIGSLENLDKLLKAA